MAKSHVKVLFLSLIAIVLVALAIYALYQTSHFSLPIPLFAPILALLTPLLLLLSSHFRTPTPQAAQPHGAPPNGPRSLANLTPLFTLAPSTVLLTLTVTLSSEALQTCRLSSHWLSLFTSKSSTPIRTIQEALHCCGLRSPHDMAWPFPDQGHGADACEHAFGWERGCLEGWRREDGRILVVMAVVGGVGVIWGVVGLVGVRWGWRWSSGARRERRERGLLEVGERPEEGSYRDDVESEAQEPSVREGDGEEEVLARLQDGTR